MSRCLSCGISFLLRNFLVSFVVARRRISVPNDLLHISLYFGHLTRCQFSSRSPVLPLSTALARLYRNCSGYFCEAACCGVNGVTLLPGSSIMCIMYSCISILICHCCHIFATGGRMLSLLSSSSCDIIGVCRFLLTLLTGISHVSRLRSHLGLFFLRSSPFELQPTPFELVPVIIESLLFLLCMLFSWLGL
jgi:hypothetical protein